MEEGLLVSCVKATKPAIDERYTVYHRLGASTNIIRRKEGGICSRLHLPSYRRNAGARPLPYLLPDITQSMITTMKVKLVEEGEINWSTPVSPNLQTARALGFLCI